MKLVPITPTLEAERIESTEPELEIDGPAPTTPTMTIDERRALDELLRSRTLSPSAHNAILKLLEIAGVQTWHVGRI